MYTLELTADKSLYEALKPEEVETKRFKMSVAKIGNKTKISVDAKDAIALKAITTTIIRLIEVFEKIQ